MTEDPARHVCVDAMQTDYDEWACRECGDDMEGP